MLRIEDFIVQGSEGSGNFGRPIPVEDGEAVAKLLSMLGKNPRSGELDQTSTLGPLPQVQSQESVLADDAFPPGDSTTAGFSTQAPTKVPNGTTAGRHKDATASNQALLALLNRTKDLQASTRSPGPARISESPYVQKPCDNQVNGCPDSVSPSSSTSGQHSTMPSTSTNPPIELRAGSQQTFGHLQGNVLLSQVISESDISRGQQAGRAMDGSINDGILLQDISLARGVENSTGVREDSDKSSGYNGTILKPHQITDTISRPAQDADNPWEGLSRIPRKYVQIPKDQRAILEHDNAWYTQAPGDRQPRIRLPYKVFKDVQAFHDGLGNRVSNGETDSDGDSDNESPRDDYSGSYSEHSEKQKKRPVKDSHGMEKAVRRPVVSKNLPSSGVVPSSRGKAMTHIPSSESVLSDQGDSSVEGSLDLVEIGSEREISVENTKGSYIQVDKILPNGKILLDTRVDIPSASLDHEDGSSADETISWSLSPNGVEAYSSPVHSLHEGLQGSANKDPTNGPNSFQSQLSPIQASPIELIDAESPSTEEDDGDSEVELFSVLQNRTEHHPAAATGRMIQASKTGLKSSSGIFSSSPVEMEVSVPYALGNQTQSPDDVVMTDMFDGAQLMPSTREQPHSSFDIKRTPHVSSGSRSPRKSSYNAKSDESRKLRQQRANISSDPIIPGTFRSEASNTSTHQGERLSATCEAGLKSNILEADQAISATPDHPTRLHSHALVPLHEGKFLAQRQKHAESETPMQKSHDVRSGKDTSLSMDNTSKAPVGRPQSWNTNDIEIPTLPTVHEPSQLSIPGSQVSPSEPLPSSPHAPIGGETILSTIATTIKRRVSGMRDMIEPSPKRRRTLQAVIFDSAPEKDSVIDPTEMAKANRRKFLQELSLSSPIQSPQKPREDTTVRFHMASDAVAEMLFENTPTRDSIRAWSDDISPTSQLHGENDTTSVHLEKNYVEMAQDDLIDYSGHDADIYNKEGPHEGRDDNGDTQDENTCSHRGNIPKNPERDSAENFEHVQGKDSTTVTKVQSDDEHPSQTETVFDIFNKTYPSYGKSLRAFIRACICLDWLHSIKKAPHPSLWDDFIRAFSAEYLSHIKDCEVSKQRPMSAPEFYNIHVPEPVFMERIMTLARLQEAFLLDPVETAKGRAKTHRKKHQSGQESISIASSQITTTSKTLAERQDTPTAFLEISSSIQQQPSPAANMSYGPPARAGNVQIASSPVLGVVSAQDSAAAVKKPFFETPSQLVTQTHRNNLPRLGAPIPVKLSRNYAIVEDPPEHIGSPDIEIVQAKVVKQSPRHLPWSSSPQEKLEPGDLIEVNGTVPRRSGARSRDQSSRQPPLIGSLKHQQGSPILGSVTSNSNATENQTPQSKNSPALSSNLGFRQDPIFKTPHLPASKSLGRRTTSMSRPVENGLDDWRTSHRDEAPHSQWSVKAPNPTIPTITATFKDFSKAFVPRQKRRSSVFSRVSTPSSDESPSWIVASNTLESKMPVEPDTQVWRF
jgi:hypothetical protein